MWGRVREILRKELRQALREPRMQVILFLPPVLQLIIFGFAVNLDVVNSPIAWMDQDRTPESRDLLASFKGSRYFQITATPETDAEAQTLLDHSRVYAVIRVLPGFARQIYHGDTANVQILVDGSNSNTASIISAYATQVVTAYANMRLQQREKDRLVGLTAAAGGAVNQDTPGLNAENRIWFNPDLLSRNYFVPGVVVNISALVTLMLTAMAIVREKEIGTMEQLMVTPIRPVELMLGKTLPFAMVGLFDVALVTVAALVIFHIPFRGNALCLLIGTVLFVLSSLGVGLFISTISGTQQQAVMSSFFFFSPAFMLSGFTFPIRNMPLPVQYLSYLNPVRYFLEIVRGIFLKGIGLSVLWPQMVVLLIFGVAILTFSALRFHKSLD
jgi:ABC-2 type transport system permease protein